MAASAEDCIFCKIVRREAPASIVREDASTLAFMDIQPMNTGHVLVIPKAHAEYVEDLPPGVAGPILEAAKEVSRALRVSGWSWVVLARARGLRSASDIRADTKRDSGYKTSTIET